jgi:hypothetical protein
MSNQSTSSSINGKDGEITLSPVNLKTNEGVIISNAIKEEDLEEEKVLTVKDIKKEIKKSKK